MLFIYQGLEAGREILIIPPHIVAHVALNGQVDRVDPKADLEAAQEEDDVNPFHHGSHGGRHHEVLQARNLSGFEA